MSDVVLPLTKKCPHCRVDIDKKAKKCQHCATDLRGWFSRHPIITVLLITFFVPTIISSMIKDAQHYDTTPPTIDPQKVILLNDLSIVSSRIVTNSIGTPEWYVVIKNTGKKTVDAYSVAGDLYDNFDTPVGKFNSTSGNTFSGISQDILKPNASEEDVFNLAVYDHATKVKNPKITRIHFTDGTTVDTNN